MNTARAQQTTPRDVWQDKRVDSRARIASPQPVALSDSLREQAVNTPGPRSQKHSTRRKLSQITSWVDDPIILQLKEHARAKKLSMSETIRGLLREILRQRYETQQAATLPELIESSVARANRRLVTSMAFFLVRIAFDVGHIKVLSTNTLGMQPGMTEAMLKEILASADKRTKANLTRKNPELTELMEAVEEWLLHGEGSQEGKEGARR